MCNCKNIKIGSYGNQVELIPPPFMLPLKNCLGEIKKPVICVDICLANEIMQLWEVQIHTIGCCCGHNKTEPYIQVIDSDIKKMEMMGYLHTINVSNPFDKSCFLPKSF